MSAFEIARAIADLETAAELLTRSAEVLSAWDHNYDETKELETVRELNLKRRAGGCC